MNYWLKQRPVYVVSTSEFISPEDLDRIKGFETSFGSDYANPLEVTLNTGTRWIVYETQKYIEGVRSPVVVRSTVGIIISCDGRPWHEVVNVTDETRVALKEYRTCRKEAEIVRL
jgi:hypothetical protein